MNFIINSFDNFTHIFNINERQQLFANASESEREALTLLPGSVTYGLELSELQQEVVTNFFRNLNITNRNQHNSMIFCENIINSQNKIKRCFSVWFESDALHFAIFGVPQLGKTEEIFNCILYALNKNVFSILTSDNSCIQLNQMNKRFIQRIEKEKSLNENFIAPTIINMNEMTTKEFKSKVTDFIKRGDSNFVLMGLSNSANISTLNILFTELVEMKEFKKFKQILKVHDEGDTIIKNEKFNECDDGYAKSHNEWIKFSKLLSKNTQLKNVYTTATPECIYDKVDIKCKDILFLEPKSNYTGYKKIEYIEIDEKINEDEMLGLMKTEVNRITNEKSCEIIIYGVEHATSKQEILVEKISNEMQNDKCIVHSYNSDKIVIKIDNEEIFKNFYEILFRDVPAELWNPDYSTNETKQENFKRYIEKNETRFTLPYKFTYLSELYDMFQESGAYCVVTVGKYMFGRGISVVGGNRNISNPFTASVLFSKPNDPYMVYLLQFWGRLNGTVRPELKRKIYAPKKHIDYFIKHYDKQESDIKDFKKLENSEKLTRDIIANKVYKEGTSNNIEKKNVKLSKINIMEPEDRFNRSELSSILNDNRDIKGKIIRYLFDKNEITYEQLLVGIEYQNSGSRSDMEGLISNISNCRNYVTTRVNNDTHYIKLNEQTRTQMQNNPTNF